MAFAIAGAVLAAYQPAAAALETSYLTLVGGCVLAGAVLLEGAGSRTQAAAAVLAMLALWGLPAGPPRGIVVGVVLVAAFLLAAWRRLRLGKLDAAAGAGGALALHALLRAGELLPAVVVATGAAGLARLVVPPVLAGLALASLARRHALGAVLTAGAVAALAAQGFTVTGALPLLAIATVDALHAWLARRRIATGSPRTVRDVDGVAAAGFAVAVVALGAARPAAGALAIAAAALAMLPRVWVWGVVAAPLAFGLATHADPQRLFALAALLALLPCAFLPGAADWQRVLGAMLVGAGGALLLPPPTGLAAAVVALALAAECEGERGQLQRCWLAFLLALTALAAGYPWLRSQPLDVALRLLGLPAVSAGRDGLIAAVALVAGAVPLLFIATRTSQRLATGLLAGGLAVAALVAMPPPARNVAPVHGVVLRGDAPEWNATLEDSNDPPVDRVRVLSTLADAAELPAGTAVATLSLERDGRPLAAWTLRAGKDTAEWAADRSDLRGSAAAGPAWWSWLPPPGTFFAHAYASTWRLARPVPMSSIRVVRDPNLPPNVTLSLLRVELSR